MNPPPLFRPPLEPSAADASDPEDKDVMVYQASGLVTTVTTLALDSDDDLLTGNAAREGSDSEDGEPASSSRPGAKKLPAAAPGKKAGKGAVAVPVTKAAKALQNVSRKSANAKLLQMSAMRKLKVTAVVRCSSDKQGVFTASTLPELHTRVGSGETAWCGWRQLWSGGPCNLLISPFQDVYIAAVLPQGHSRATASPRATAVASNATRFPQGTQPCTFAAGMGNSGSTCNVSATAATSSWMLGGAAAGLALFLLAEPLSTSVTVRVTSGGILFSVGSILIVMFIMLRLLPNKRSLLASALALGSSGLGILRWATGHWLPDLDQLLHSPATLAYLLCSTLVGAAVTYVYGGTDNPRINTVVRAGLRLLGMALMYTGMWTHVGAFAAAAATAVLGHVMVPSISRRVREAKQRRQEKLDALLHQQQHNQHTTQQQLNTGPDRTHTQHTSTATASQASRRQDAANAAAAAAAGGSSPPAHRSRTPIHLREGPPSPWAVSDRAFRRGKTTSPSPDVEDTREEFDGSGTPAGRGRGGGGFAVASASSAPAFSPLRPGNGASPSQAAGGDVSPLVKAGQIYNVETGRTIKIAGALYNKLTESGYTTDVHTGLLSPPASEHKTPGSEQRTTPRRRGRM
ncbi:MAG: hypothetical protein WDW36_005859 [Sanguina aurantia]